MKSYVLLLTILLFILSCDNNKKKEDLICNNNFKYWDVIENRTSDKKYIHGYCFYSTGRYTYFNYNNNKRFVYYIDDIVIDRNWKYLNDSFIILGNGKVRILKLTRDTFIFQWNDLSVVKLKKSLNQIDTIGPPNEIKPNIIWDTLSK